MLPSGVILRLKRNPEGSPVRYKARLVARGNFQSDAGDYTELYAPVECIEVLRILLSVAVSNIWAIEQLDVKGAFLHADLPDSEKLWIRLPSIGVIGTASGKVVQLRKSLYGLLEAPKLWYEHFKNKFYRIGFTRSKSSDCFFISQSNSAPDYIVVYVDELLLLGSSTAVSNTK